MIKNFTSLALLIALSFSLSIQQTHAQSIMFLANLPGFIQSDVKASNEGAIWYFYEQDPNTLMTTKIICNMDLNENVLWTKSLNEDFGYGDMVAQQDGSLIIGGIKSSPGSSKAALLKIDVNGNPLWSKTITGQTSNYVTSIQANNNIIYAAITSNSFGGGTQFYNSTIIGFGQNGAELWKRNFSHPTSATDYIFSRTALAANGDLLALADIRGSSNAQANGLMITRITPQGSVVFSKYFSFVADYNQLSSNGIVETSGGDIIIGGRLMTDQISTFPNNLFMAKLSASGEVLLQKQISGGFNVGEQLLSLRRIINQGINEDIIFALIGIAPNNPNVERGIAMLKFNQDDLSIEANKHMRLSSYIFEDPYGQNRNSFDIADDESLFISGGFFVQHNRVHLV